MQREAKKEKRKRLVRYKDGAEMYSMGLNKFQALAKDAGAILKIDRMVLVDLDRFDEYLETFRVQRRNVFYTGERFFKIKKIALDLWLN